jgi:hypothetical protein
VDATFDTNPIACAHIQKAIITPHIDQGDGDPMVV